jgi:DNA-binding NtrC family response regulator
LPQISSEACTALTKYSYPGNVRELAHAIEHAVVLAGPAEIGLDHLPAAIVQAGAATTAPQDPVAASVADLMPVVPPGTVRLADAVKAFERAHLQRVLAAAGGKRLRAAEMLGISRKSLWEKLREQEPRSPSASLPARDDNAT